MVVARWQIGRVLVSLIIGYAVLVNFVDLATRPAYWFDNRPLVYQFIYKEIGKFESSIPKVRVTTLVGEPELYCKYYLGQCPSTKYLFKSFSLAGSPATGGVLYAGFLGEYLGQAVENSLPANWTEKLPKMGLLRLADFNTRDTVAYHYGDIVLVAIAR